MDKDIIQKRINLMLKCLERLKRFELISFEQYRDNFDYQLIGERLIEIIVELASDINNYLLVQIYQTAPETYSASFIEAGKKRLISQNLAEELAKSAKMRNILVHQYIDVDHQIVYLAISKALDQYPRYIQEITNFLDSLEEK